MTLRWRKNPRETGLRAVGAGERGSQLYLDKENDCLASVAAHGGGWRGPVIGWYWVAPSNEDKNIEYYNSYCEKEIFETEKEAKDAAKKYVQEAMKK